MDTLTAGVPPTTNPRTAPDGAARGAIPDLGPGWIMLRNCALGGGGPRVSLALLHPGVGIALVDSVPKQTDAVTRLLRALDARRFPAIFGSYPPIVRVVLPSDRSSELGHVLAEAFGAQPPLAQAGGDAWIGTARAAIEAELPVAAPELLRRPRQHRAFPWRAAVLAAVVGGCAAAALALVFALPGHDGPRDASRRPAFLASAAAPGVVASDSSPEAAPVGDEFTALDVAAALTSAEPGAGARTASGSPMPWSAPTATTATDERRPEPVPLAPATASVHQPQPAPPVTAATQGTPEAAPEPQTPASVAGTTLATGPEQAGGAPAATSTTSEDVPELTPPAPVMAETPAAPVAGSDPAPEFAPPQFTPPATAAFPNAADAVAEPRPLPKRAAPPPPDAPARTAAAQAPATVGRRAPLPVAEAGGAGGRCREILVRATMGGALSDGDKEFLRRGCQPPG